MTSDPTGTDPVRTGTDAATVAGAGAAPEPAGEHGTAARQPDVTSSVPAPPGSGVTRVSAVWVAIGVALLFLVLLIVFILQNLDRVSVHFLGLSPSLPLGVALLIAAVVGGIVVAVAGAARVIQLRRTAKRVRR